MEPTAWGRWLKWLNLSRHSPLQVYQVGRASSLIELLKLTFEAFLVSVNLNL